MRTPRAVIAAVILTATGCSSSSGPPGATSGGVDQSSPEALAIDVVDAARQGQDVSPYALADRDSAQTCTTNSCDDLPSLARAEGTCTELDGELTAHRESAGRDDSTSVLVHLTTAEDSSGTCGPARLQARRQMVAQRLNSADQPSETFCAS